MRSLMRYFEVMFFDLIHKTLVGEEDSRATTVNEALRLYTRWVWAALDSRGTTGAPPILETPRRCAQSDVPRARRASQTRSTRRSRARRWR